MTTTTILIASLSIFMLLLAFRLWRIGDAIDELEIRILKLEKGNRLQSQGDQR